MAIKQTWLEYDARQRKHASMLVNRLNAIYDAMCKEAAKIGAGTGFSDPEREFYLKDFPMASSKVDALLKKMSDSISGLINQGTEESWRLSWAKNEAMLKQLTSYFNLPKERVQGWSQRNVAALEAFQQRKVNGMGLSERVWDFVKHDKERLEMALELGLAEGKSAAALSRDVRQYLNKPDKLFRRVRDKDGNLRLSKAAQAYHPGQGVYRSSYKNALRMTITETNMAYRTADHDQWQGMPFVIGQTIKLSNNHTCKGVKGVFRDICDELQGDYPKEFKFVGWHPSCRCYVIAKLPSREEMRKYNRMTDEEQAEYHFEGEVKEPPQGFVDWIDKNEARIDNASSKPYFISDNYPQGNVGRGFVWEQKADAGKIDGSGMKQVQELTDEQRREITLARAKQRHEERTAEQVADIQTRWNRHRIEDNGDGYSLQRIDRYISKHGVDRAEFDAMMAKPLTYDSKSYEFPQLTAMVEKYSELAEIAMNKAVMRRGELFGYRLEAEKLGAKGKKFGDKIYRHIQQVDRRSDSTAYWNSEKEAAQIATAKRKIEEMKAHRADVLKAWRERQAAQSAGIFDKIAKADSPEALASLMKDARIVKDFDLGKMPLEAQKTVAEVAAKMHSTYGLEPIDIRMKDFPKKNSNTFMWAHGGHVELNSKYWEKDALEKTTSETFDSCVTEWRKSHEKRVKTYEEWIADWKKKLAATDDAWDKKSYEKLIKQYSKEIEKEKKMLDTGMSRHNVFLSKETMLRDCFTHETGHTVHDQILGGINGYSFRQRRFSATDTNIINEEFKVLYRRHKRLGGGWLSEYGLTDWQEFMSESMVLYTHAPEKLPADVKAWFDLLGDYAKTGKLPARDKMPSVAFKPEKKRTKSPSVARAESAEQYIDPRNVVYRDFDKESRKKNIEHMLENRRKNLVDIPKEDTMNGRLQIASTADNSELNANARCARSILRSFDDVNIRIREDYRFDKVKNPEYCIGEILADRKGVESPKGISAGFQKAIKQHSNIVVIDFDFKLKGKYVNPNAVASRLYGRKEDFATDKIKECYVVHNDKAVRFDASIFLKDKEESVKMMLEELKKLEP